MRVTFDSNVFQFVVKPDLSPKDPDADAFRSLNSALRKGTLRGFISETMATLESIKKGDRQNYFSSIRPQVEFNESETETGEICLRVTVKPDEKMHPGLPPVLSARLSEAFALGFRFLRCPRIGAPRPITLKEEWFLSETDAGEVEKRHDLYHEVGRAIESREVGIAVAKRLAGEIAAQHRFCGPWYEAWAVTDDSLQKKRIAEAVAEWADGDAVAAHIGYGNHFFCTRDEGKSAGESILNAKNRAWLIRSYSIQFVTPAELAGILSRNP